VSESQVSAPSDGDHTGAETLADGAWVGARRDALVKVGDRVGRYAILEIVGSGGMGVVFSAYDPELDRKVALKLVRPDGGDTRSDLRQGRLLREAQAMARVTHPNVLPVHDAGTCDAGVFLAMEFVDGETLDQRLARHRDGSARLTTSEIIKLFAQAGRGIQAAHEAGLVHRDFKPDNVMLGQDGRARVMDFGLARAPTGAATDDLADESVSLDALSRRSGITEDLTRTGAIMGTPAYMSPEQHLGRSADAASDQFSFCVALWEALFSERPFAGKTIGQLANSVIGGERRPAPSSDVPGRVVSAIERGLARRPEDRWPDMAPLLEALSTDHAARIRQRWVGVGTVLLTSAAVAAAYQARPDESTPCADATVAMAQNSWTGARRAMARDAFEGTELSYAREAWTATAQTLDAFAQRWSASRSDACEASLVRHEQSSELFDRRVACLERARGEFDAIMELFTQADAGVVERSIRIASGMPALDRCDDAEALLAAVPPPETAALAEQVDTIRGTLAEARAQYLAGQYPAALKMATDVLPAEDFAYPPARAEVLASLGPFAAQSGDYEAAEAHLKDALYLARVHRHDEVAFTATSHLTHVVGHLAQRVDEGLTWAWHARADLERLGSPPADQAFLEQNLGMLHSDKGDYEAARRSFETTLEIRNDAFGPDDSRTLLALNNLAIADYYLGNVEQSLATHERVLASRERVLGPNHPDVAQSLMNLGIDYERLGRYDEGIEVIQRAMEIERRVRTPDDPKLATTISNLANLYDAKREHERAIELQQQALEIREKALGPRHITVGDSLVNMGLSMDSLGRSAEALPVLHRALEIYVENRGETHYTVAVAMGNIAGATKKLGRFEEALEWERKSLKVKLAALSAGHPSLGYAYLGVATSLLGLDRPDEAIEPAENAVSVWTSAPVDPQYLANAEFTLARALMAAGRDKDRALSLARKALPAFEGDDSDAAKSDFAEVSAFIAEHG
jgi:tetratricopeptide (TPR) repeat protein